MVPGPREGGIRRALLSGGPGKSSGAPHPMETAGGPRSRRRAILVCLAGEAAGSVEPTPAHTLPESMLSAALGTSCRVAGRPGPLPARSSQSWGRQGARVGGAASACRPWGVPVRCLAFARPQTNLSPAAFATGNGGVHVIHRSPRPGPRPVGQRPGGVTACRMDPLAVRSPRARTPRGEHTGWKGVCEHGDVGAHTRCHTQCHGFVATAP